MNYIKQNKKKIVVFSSILIIIIIYFTVIQNIITSIYFDSKGFYFESETLSEKNVQNWYHEKVYIELSNNLGEKITDEDIEYKATCNVLNTSDIECRLNGTNTNSIKGTLNTVGVCYNEEIDVTYLTKTECQNQGYKWQQQEATTEIFFELKSNEDNINIEEIKVNVTVTSVSPEVKTLSNEFVLTYTEKPEITFEASYIEKEKNDTLVIANPTDVSNCISVLFPDNLLSVDEKNKGVVKYFTNNNGKINSLIITVEPYNTVEIDFFPLTEEEKIDIKTFYIENAVGCST